MIDDETLTLPTQYPVLSPRVVRFFGQGSLARRWPIHRLTRAELATVAVRIDSSVRPPKNIDVTLAGWAAIHLRAHGERGRLFGRSARDVAAELRSLFFHGRKPRYPHRGFELLALVDEVGDSTGVTVWIDAAPIKEDPYSYRPMRFKQRLTELRNTGRQCR